MKIISWNCNGALRKKTNLLDELNADLIIVQECEDPARSTKKYQDWAGNYLWIGDSKNKGIGVFTKQRNYVEKLDWANEMRVELLSNNSSALNWKTSDLRLFLPFKLNGICDILAVWTKGKRDQAFGYMGQFWKYLQLHKLELANPNCLIIGDFNSNAIWDQADRWWNHSDVVNELSELGKLSIYHAQENESHGLESQSTFYLQRNLEKAYHIDYAFLPNELIEKATLEIGDKENWLAISDHLPLILEIEDLKM